ncbi:MAG: hypothetical protein IPK68_11140 [Bdellovibrionales bacterium]|nr:hypothetical protein [Bdellovibrionales bacterium]
MKLNIAQTMFWSRRQNIRACEVYMKKPVPLSHVQRKAKQLKNESPDLKHHHALDEAAKSFGHTNFKNYKNDSAAFDKWLSAALERGADVAMEEQSEKLTAKFALVNPVFENFKVSIQDLINLFKTKKHTDEEIQSVCEKDRLVKEYLELYFLSDSLGNDDWDLVTDTPYHIPSKATVKNLKYKYGKDEFDEPTDAEVLYVEGEYEIECKIMFEHTQEDIDARDDGFFDDQTLSGTFELTIDRDKKITIGNLDMGI